MMIDPDNEPPKVMLSADVKGRIGGAPWVYANQIDMAAAKHLAPGSVVRLAQADGRQLGQYHFNPKSLIAARLLTRNLKRRLDASFFAERIERALARRSRLFDVPYYRLVHAEGDFLPGLVIDRFDDVLVVQPNTAGMMAALPLLQEALIRVLEPRAILALAQGPARQLEGLEDLQTVLHGTVEGPVAVVENGLTYQADPIGGQKTGWFYDHRPNRAFAARLAQGGSVLDLYSYAGGFGLACAAAGARSVMAIDRSGPALALAREAAQRQGLAAFDTQTVEVFGWLDVATDMFDLVIADPPAFAKSKKDVPSAIKGYAKLARLTAARVAPGGFLCLASCSHHIEQPIFLDACAAGLREAGRAGTILFQGGAGPDHPVHPSLPQTAYLKFLAFALD